MVSAGGESSEAFQALRSQSDLLLGNSSTDLNDLLLVSLIQLLLPLNLILEWFFVYKTKRKPNEIDITFINEAVLFVTIIWILLNRARNEQYDPLVPYSYPEMTPGQIFISNTIYY